LDLPDGVITYKVSVFNKGDAACKKHLTVCMELPETWFEDFATSFLKGNPRRQKRETSVSTKNAWRNLSVINGFITSALLLLKDGGEWSASHAGHFIPWERVLGTHRKEGFRSYMILKQKF
jgi:hypothetical protein